MKDLEQEELNSRRGFDKIGLIIWKSTIWSPNSSYYYCHSPLPLASIAAAGIPAADWAPSVGSEGCCALGSGEVFIPQE